MYCLWLNGKKVYDLQQLRASFDAEAVGLYCLGGGLARWLRDCGESEAAEKVERIDLSQSISAQLAEIFGVDLPKTEEQPFLPVKAAAPAPAANGSFLPPEAPVSSSSFESSFSTSSFDTSSFSTSSFSFFNQYGSFFTTSFQTTSYGYEYEHEYESGSFTTTSFSLYLSSFFAETAFLTGSFSFGSFTLGSFSTEYGSFPMSGSFPLTLSSLSHQALEAPAPAAPAETEPTPLTPQQKFELNLSSNPLNRYGYGIHLI